MTKLSIHLQLSLLIQQFLTIVALSGNKESTIFLSTAIHLFRNWRQLRGELLFLVKVLEEKIYDVPLSEPLEAVLLLATYSITG